LMANGLGTNRGGGLKSKGEGENLGRCWGGGEPRGLHGAQSKKAFQKKKTRQAFPGEAMGGLAQKVLQ